MKISKLSTDTNQNANFLTFLGLNTKFKTLKPCEITLHQDRPSPNILKIYEKHTDARKLGFLTSKLNIAWKWVYFVDGLLG
ncbi:hypothetical protein L6452_20571 [Arctium lappa]|uniref:Uncharacterized protein n=1 Tax=Arctium lappa TaxID=4217 RepID=A0ACB9BAW4_ARCLA|nr:hypothetical protein L6452_20571 [Arctium lappa]